MIPAGNIGPGKNLALSEALRVLALVVSKQGDRIKALEHFRAAAACAPDDSGIRNQIAAELIDLGRLDEAEDVARALAAERPALAAGFRALGVVARKRGDRPNALAHFRAAAERAPGDIGITGEIAALLRELQRFAEAEACAQKSVARHPASAQALTILAQCSRWRLPSHATLALFERAVAAEPANLHTQFALAAEYAGLWRLDDAARIYDSALAADGVNVSALLGKAQVARRRGDRDKCFATLSAVAKLTPDNERAMIEFAREFVDAGRLHDAEQTLAPLIERNPSRPDALVFLGQSARLRRGRKGAPLFHRRRRARGRERSSLRRACARRLQIRRAGGSRTCSRVVPTARAPTTPLPILRRRCMTSKPPTRRGARRWRLTAPACGGA